MANRLCNPCRELMRQQLGLLRELKTAPMYRQASLVAAERLSRRQLHQSSTRRQDKPSSPSAPSKLATAMMPGVASKAFGSYLIYGATEKLYKECSKSTTYAISEQLRKEGKVPLTNDGEEIGIGGGIWHERMFYASPPQTCSSGASNIILTNWEFWQNLAFLLPLVPGPR